MPSSSPSCASSRSPARGRHSRSSAAVGQPAKPQLCHQAAPGRPSQHQRAAARPHATIAARAHERQRAAAEPVTQRTRQPAPDQPARVRDALPCLRGARCPATPSASAIVVITVVPPRSRCRVSRSRPPRSRVRARRCRRAMSIGTRPAFRWRRGGWPGRCRCVVPALLASACARDAARATQEPPPGATHASVTDAVRLDTPIGDTVRPSGQDSLAGLAGRPGAARTATPPSRRAAAAHAERVRPHPDPRVPPGGGRGRLLRREPRAVPRRTRHAVRARLPPDRPRRAARPAHRPAARALPGAVHVRRRVTEPVPLHRTRRPARHRPHQRAGHLARLRAHASPTGATAALFCLLSGAEAGRSFFGNKGIEGQETAWRFPKLRQLDSLGFELCNHTLWHARLDKYPDAFVQEQIARGELAIDSADAGLSRARLRAAARHVAEEPAAGVGGAAGPTRRASARCATTTTPCSRWPAGRRAVRTIRSSTRVRCRAFRSAAACRCSPRCSALDRDGPGASLRERR